PCVALRRDSPTPPTCLAGVPSPRYRPQRSALWLSTSDTPTTEIYTLSLHDALPISQKAITLVIEVLQTINYTLTISSKHKEDSHMRLAQGIILDTEKTFGLLKFSALRCEVFLKNEYRTISIEVKERTYD